MDKFELIRKSGEVLRYWNRGHTIAEIAEFVGLPFDEVIYILDGWPDDVKKAP